MDKDTLPPCWFLSPGDFDTVPYHIVRQRQQMEDYGYPEDMPLSDAIKIFNEKQQCSSPYKSFPPLTEEELTAAILAGPDYGKQGDVWLAQKDTLWGIITKKMMPKGSLLVMESGGRALDSPFSKEAVEAKGIRISLLLELDKNNRLESILKPMQVLVIRKSVIGVQNSPK